MPVGCPHRDALRELTGFLDLGWILIHRDEMRDAVALDDLSSLPDGLDDGLRRPEAICSSA